MTVRDVPPAWPPRWITPRTYPEERIRTLLSRHSPPQSGARNAVLASPNVPIRNPSPVEGETPEDQEVYWRVNRFQLRRKAGYFVLVKVADKTGHTGRQPSGHHQEAKPSCFQVLDPGAIAPAATSATGWLER